MFNIKYCAYLSCGRPGPVAATAVTGPELPQDQYDTNFSNVIIICYLMLLYIKLKLLINTNNWKLYQISSIYHNIDHIVPVAALVLSEPHHSQQSQEQGCQRNNELRNDK